MSLDDLLIVGIEQEGEHKYIHYYGYGYVARDTTKDKQPYNFVEYSWFIVPLKIALQDGIYRTEATRCEQYTQHVAPHSAEEMISIFRHYDNGQPPRFIHRDAVTVDTPVGVYVLFKEDK